jgi:hypothetical protein
MRDTQTDTVTLLIHEQITVFGVPPGSDPLGGRFEWGEQTIEAYTGDALVIEVELPMFGWYPDDVVIFSHIVNGKPYGYAHTAQRNRTRKDHPLVDLTAGTIGGRINPYSPANGARIEGVVHADNNVSPEELAAAVGQTPMAYEKPGQCTDWVWTVSSRAGTGLPVKFNFIEQWYLGEGYGPSMNAYTEASTLP